MVRNMKTIVLLSLPFLIVNSQSVLDTSRTNPAWTNLIEEKREHILNYIKDIKLPNLEKSEGTEDDAKVCNACRTIVDSVIDQRKHGASREFIFNELFEICQKLKVAGARVCRGAVDLNLDTLLYVADHNITVSRFCGIVFQNFNCPYVHKNWNVNIPVGETSAKNQVNKHGKSFNILHMSDIHYDPRYTPGNNAVCWEPVCCQDDQPPSKKAEENCGYWGDYRLSDTPWHTVVDTLNQTLNHDYRYVYYTGDTIAHRVWETSIESNSRTITQLFEQFKKTYNVPVYMVLGNHDPHPADLYAPSNITDENYSTHWLYNLAADSWSEWLPDDALDTVRKCGYYTVQASQGFRIIALNNNVCYSYNWWLLLDDEDPCGQLAWLVEVLTSAEQAGESVHIIAHIPSGDPTCIITWSREYANIVRRFANTITGQFVGHTHSDEFHLYPDNQDIDLVPYGVAFNGASVTTYSNNNPSYKLFNIDEETKGLLDYEEWIFDVTEANIKPDQPPNWHLLYKFSEAYGVETLDPVEIGHLVNRMASGRHLNDKYFSYKSRNASTSTGKTCDNKCHKQNLCSMVTSVHGDILACEDIQTKYDLYNGQPTN